MKRVLLLALIVALALPVGAKNKKSELPMQVVAAQFVYITSLHGDSFNPNTTPEEREAMNKLESYVRTWGRYKVVYRPEEANLMLIVKTASMVEGRISNAPIDPTSPQARVGVGNIPADPGQAQPDPRLNPNLGGLGTGVDVSSDPNDMLMVSLDPQASAANASFVWRRSARKGLQGPKPELFEEFRKAVDDTERQNAKP